MRLLIGSLAILVTAVAAAQDAVAVGTATAGRGVIAYGTIDVPAASDAALSIPVILANGTRRGPTVLFLAGSHGTEYASIVALQRLVGRIDAKSLAGTVIIVPLVNVASFDQMTVHTNPVDKKSMNGQYPGDGSGTQTQRALAAVVDQAVKRAGVIVDLHGGDLDEDLVPYSYWFRTGNAEQDAASRKLALSFGLERIIVTDIDTMNPASTRSLSGYGLSLGKTVLVAEAGASGDMRTQDVAALVDGCLNVLATLQMIDRVATPIAHPIWLGSGSRVRAQSPGMFIPAVRGGTYVSSGMRIGTMTDYFGRPSNDITAPISGLVTFIRGVPSAWKDATLVNIAPVYEEPPPYRNPSR